METLYSDLPENYEAVLPFMETNIENIKQLFFSGRGIFFYDACSFQKHANLEENQCSILADYFKKRGGIIFITAGVMIEVVGNRRKLDDNYIRYLNLLSDNGVKIVLFREETSYNILAECFATNDKINEILMWAVRNVKSSVGTISETLKKNDKLAESILLGKNHAKSDLYKKFFSEVRKNKESKDNLGEELIAVCVGILSGVPGNNEKKLYVVTDDKWAAVKIESVKKKEKIQNGKTNISIISTPKIVSHIIRERGDESNSDMVSILSRGAEGNIVIRGLSSYDFEINSKTFCCGEELVKAIMEDKGFVVVF